MCFLYKSEKTACPFRSPNTSDLQCQNPNFVVLYYNMKNMTIVTIFFHVKLFNFLTVSLTPNIEIFLCTEPKQNCLSLPFYFHFLVAKIIILIILLLLFHFYSAHIHYLSEALYKIISKTTIIKFRNKKLKTKKFKI